MKKLISLLILVFLISCTQSVPPESEIEHSKKTPLIETQTINGCVTYSAANDSIFQHQVGMTERPYKDYWRARVGDGDSSGFLTYGPYMHFDAGTLTVTFTVQITSWPESADTPVAVLDITKDWGRPILQPNGEPTVLTLTRGNFTGAWKDHNFTLEVSLDNPIDHAEMRIFWNGSVDIRHKETKICWSPAEEQAIALDNNGRCLAYNGVGVYHNWCGAGNPEQKWLIEGGAIKPYLDNNTCLSIGSEEENGVFSIASSVCTGMQDDSQHLWEYHSNTKQIKNTYHHPEVVGDHDLCVGIDVDTTNGVELRKCTQTRDQSQVWNQNNVPPPISFSPNIYNDNNRSNLGTNLVQVSNWTGSAPFINLMKMASEWQGNSFTSNLAGWITSGSARSTIINTAGLYNQTIKNVIPTDIDYLVIWDGAGSVTASNATEIESVQGKKRIKINGDSKTFWIKVEGPVFNIRIVPTGGVCENNVFTRVPNRYSCTPQSLYRSFEFNYDDLIFMPKFLDNLKYYNTIRFMDWARTNQLFSTWPNNPGPTVIDWSWSADINDKTRVAHIDDAIWSTEKGVPISIMVKLANILDADPWFNIPHLASETYVREHAKTVKKLEHNLHVYLEYSNEIWNSGKFAQFYTILKNGQVDTNSRLEDVRKKYAVNAATKINHWLNAFNDYSRVTKVLSGWSKNITYNERLMDTVVWDQTTAAEVFNAFAIAPYFGFNVCDPSRGDCTNQITPADVTMASTQIIECLLTGMGYNSYCPKNDVELSRTIQTVIGWAEQNNGKANARGLSLIAYEGGQHLVSNVDEASSTYNKLYSANTDNLMQTAYKKYLDAWWNASTYQSKQKSNYNGQPQLFMHFNNVSGYSKYGFWGALEYQQQENNILSNETTPKYQALYEYSIATTHPRSVTKPTETEVPLPPCTCGKSVNKGKTQCPQVQCKPSF